VIKPVSVNERRDIYEVVNGITLQRIQAFKFYPSRTSGGNHYHKKLKEYFFVIQGTMTILVLEHTRTKEREVFRNLGEGSLIIVPPLIAHANCFEAGTVMVAGCTTAHDPNDEDAYQYPLLDEEGNELNF
jgi:mannose-6-phosphate isomerase-like protein (cupin superfamily)